MSIIVGVVLGFLSGLGTGGGSLLILWLTLVMHMDYGQARIINLLFFIPSALIASLFRWKQGKLDLKKVLPAIVSGIACAALGTWFSAGLNTNVLKKLFGVILLAAGIRELFYRPRKFKSPSRINDAATASTVSLRFLP